MRAKFVEARMNADGTQMNAGNLKTLDVWATAWAQGGGGKSVVPRTSAFFARIASRLASPMPKEAK